MSIRVPPARLSPLTLAAVTAAALILGPSPAAAQETPPPPPSADPAPAPAPAAGVDVPSDAEDTGEGKKKKKKKSAAEATDSDGAPSTAAAQMGDARIELRGRVFAAGIYEDQEIEGNVGARSSVQPFTLSVTSARFGVAVDLLDFVSMQIEAELAGSRARLRDGFVQAKKKRWLVRGGQFKMPISVFTLESPWKLPLARRGWLHELLSDHLMISGRREGFMGQISGGGGWDPALTVGAFRSVHWGSPNAGDPVLGLRASQQTVVGRFSVTPAGIEIAAVGQRRTTYQQQSESIEDYWAAGLESTGDLEFERTAVRFWAEGLVGSNFLSFDPASRQRVRFFAGRALGAWRWGGLEAGELYVEPFATAGMLDANMETTSDGFLEVMAGVNVGHWRRTRLTLQLEYGTAGRNLPRSYFVDFEKPFLVTHRAALLQVGAAF